MTQKRHTAKLNIQFMPTSLNVLPVLSRKFVEDIKNKNKCTVQSKVSRDLSLEAGQQLEETFKAVISRVVHSRARMLIIFYIKHVNKRKLLQD